MFPRFQGPFIESYQFVQSSARLEKIGKQNSFLHPFLIYFWINFHSIWLWACLEAKGLFFAEFCGYLILFYFHEKLWVIFGHWFCFQITKLILLGFIWALINIIRFDNNKSCQMYFLAGRRTFLIPRRWLPCIYSENIKWNQSFMKFPF